MKLKKQKPFERGAGILLPISSIPSLYGIGTFGKAAYEFVDFLKNSGQKYWQILPLCPTSYGDSPYQSFSAFAGNPYFIDLDMLAEEGLLEKSRIEAINWGETNEVDYSILFNERFKLLKSAYERSTHFKNQDYELFCKENSFWLEDYCLYMALKVSFGHKEWLKWPDNIKSGDINKMTELSDAFKDDINFWKFCQFKFSEQWMRLKEYANLNGIKIIGDIPLYVAMDSADVWVHYKYFDLDVNRQPNHVAGVPPDIFSKTGQLWGNPLYNWENTENEGFTWWYERIKMCSKLYDIIRIDHFIGIVRYYSIPAERNTAIGGRWQTGPGEKLIEKINAAKGNAAIIAEDLGVVTKEVKKLLRKSGYPGMKLLEMAFDNGAWNENLPFHYEKNCVVYGGTHDNETLAGYFSHTNKNILNFAKEYLHIRTKLEIPWAIIRAAYGSTANTVIFQLQDFLELDNRARINTPSTIGNNWKWRLGKGQLTKELSDKIKNLTLIYGR